jgi:hypothetical protein
MMTLPSCHSGYRYWDGRPKWVLAQSLEKKTRAAGSFELANCSFINIRYCLNRRPLRDKADPAKSLPLWEFSSFFRASWDLPMTTGKAVLSLFAAVAGLGYVSAAAPAVADNEDAAWIKKCVTDNKREGATPEVVAAYCACMNGKMSSDETRSITAWEKTHPDEMAACEKESGWE